MEEQEEYKVQDKSNEDRVRQSDVERCVMDAALELSGMTHFYKETIEGCIDSASYKRGIQLDAAQIEQCKEKIAMIFKTLRP